MSNSRALETDQLASIAAHGSRLISRRAVVRTGVTTAWSVPLIQVVGAAPALAVSGAKVAVVGGNAVWDGNYIDVTVPLKSSGQTVNTVTISLTFSAGLAPAANDAPKGWSTSRSTSGGTVTLTYTTPSAGVTSAGQSFFFQVKDKDHKGAAGSVSVAVVTKAGATGTAYGIKSVVKS